MAKAKPLKLNPLSVNDIQAAKDGIVSSEALIEYWSKCTDCTMDVKPLIEQTRALHTFLTAVVSKFAAGATNE